MESFDYIVVGAGACGSVVAGRLAERGDLTVLLLEAGPSDRRALVRIPGLGFIAASTPKLNWNFATEPVDGLDGRRLVLLQGRVLGGSGSINGMIYTRGNPADFDAWESMGCPGWGAAGLAPYFDRALAGTGQDRRMRIRRSSALLPICDAFLEAATQAGHTVLDDLDGSVPDSFGYYKVNIDQGLRRTAAVAYLRPVERGGSLSVKLGAEVQRILVEGGCAVGVEYVEGGERKTARARREVILSAGAIKSPQLLMLSGIGPADALRRLGLEVHAESPEVGRNLQNHPCYRPQFACSAPVTAYSYVGATGAARAITRYAVSRSGPLAESFAVAGGFFRTDPALEASDAQVVLLSAMMAKPMPGRVGWRHMLPTEHGFAMTVYQGTPLSRGAVELASADPAVPPRIWPNYFAVPQDARVLARAVQHMRDLASRPALARWIAMERLPGRDVVGEEALIAEIRRNAATSYHQCGTCRMGDDPDSVVDPSLKVRGVTGLRVADASIIPRLPNAALHAPVIAIGEKAAAMILGEDDARAARTAA